jgi:hypothetical protein
LLATACTTASLVRSHSMKLKLSMTPEEVLDVMGEPDIREASTRDSHAIECWSYFVVHQRFTHQAGDPPDTSECLTFVDGRLTEWVEDVGMGGHSNHRRQ